MSVSVSAPVSAALDVDPAGEYGRFVPVPGHALTVVARVPDGTARFRFELHPQNTSHSPGYARNANVDDTYFVGYNLGDLRGRYANDGPDVIFHPRDFGAQEWARIEPLVVETRTAQSAALAGLGQPHASLAAYRESRLLPPSYDEPVWRLDRIQRVVRESSTRAPSK